MKRSIIILVTFMSIAGLPSCKKEHANKNLSTIEGKWVGSYVNDASGNTFYYSFNIKPGGIIEELNSSGQLVGSGNWELSNDILSAYYNYLPPSNSSYSVIGAFDKNSGKLAGDWGYGNNATNGGTWEMTKQ